MLLTENFPGDPTDDGILRCKSGVSGPQLDKIGNIELISCTIDL